MAYALTNHITVESSAEGADRSRRKWRGRRVARWLEHLLACVGVCFISSRICFEYTVMTSGSMSPTLRGEAYETGDRIVLEKVTGYFRKPRRWEIYFYHDDDGNPVTKRIVGMPGEKISLKDNRIRINGVEVPRPEHLADTKYYPLGNLTNGREVECGEGYFMMGDSSKDSYDSRYTGVVSGRRFHGRAWCIVSPNGHRGFVK